MKSNPAARPSGRSAVVVALASVLLALAGCGAEVHVSTTPDELSGPSLAKQANTQLEKQNPQLTHGQLTCDSVKFKVGATSRCLRTVTLEDGRLVRIGATVTVDRTTKGGHYKIAVDDKPQEYGLTGKAVLADIVKQYAAAYKTTAPTGTCPDFLAGKVGTVMKCTLDTTDQGKVGIDVTVTSVDPATFNTVYTFKVSS